MKKEQNVVVSTRGDGSVHLELSQSATDLGMNPKQAVELGTMLIQQAAISTYRTDLQTAQDTEPTA